MPPLPPGVSETRSAHARCPHRGAGRCGGSFGARLRVPKSAQSRGCGARGTSRRRFSPPPQELALCRGQQRWGLVVLCLLGRFGPGLLLCPRRKGGSGGQESQGRGERREGKKKIPQGTAAAGLAQPGRERAGPAGGRVGQSLGKPPPGVGGHAPVACTPGEPAGGGGCPSTARERVFP